MPNPASQLNSSKRPLRVAWITYFPIEWLPELPPELQGLPKLHPATWQRVLWEEFRKDENLELHIIVLRNHFKQTVRFRRDNTTFHCIKTVSGTRAPSLFWTDTFFVARELKRINPELVHAWGSEFGAAAIAARLKWPALVTMQGILTWYGSVFPLNRHGKIGCFLEPPSLRKAHVVTCESSFGLKYLAERYPNLKLIQAEHAPNPLFSRVHRSPQLAPIRIVCVGSFMFAKGADIALLALDKLIGSTDFSALWIGPRDPALEAELRGRVSDALWQRLTFKHGLTQDEVAHELSRTTLFLHAARADNSPNAVKEAVVAGVPVVATRTGGIPDYVFPEKNGLMFESGNVEDCYAKIKQALQHPLLGSGKVDSATLAHVREYLSAATMADKFMNAYKVALSVDPHAKHRSAA